MEKPPALVSFPLNRFLEAVGLLMFFFIFSHTGILREYSKVVTYKNNALDHFLEECQGLSPRPRIIRVGKASSSERLKGCLLAKVRFVGSTRLPGRLKLDLQ